MTKVVKKVYEPRGYEYPNPCSELQFNPTADVAAVDQVGFVDLNKAFVNATIPGDLIVDESKYNGVDDPASLVNRPKDVFEATRNFDKARAAHAADAAAEAAAASSAEHE